MVSATLHSKAIDRGICPQAQAIDRRQPTGSSPELMPVGSNFGDTGSEMMRSGTIEEVMVMANAGRKGCSLVIEQNILL